MAKRKSPASATDTKHVTGHDIQDAFNPSVPLYHQIYLQLKDELTDGIWYGSQSFYGEDELARTYGVSNITARKVLGKLAEEGLIQRSRGRRARADVWRRRSCQRQRAVCVPARRGAERR